MHQKMFPNFRCPQNRIILSIYSTRKNITFYAREIWKGSISICHILYCLLHLTMKKIFFLKIHENDVVETLHKCFLTFHNCVLIDMQVGHQIEQVLIDFTTTKWHCLVRAGQIIHPHLFTPLLQILQSFL